MRGWNRLFESCLHHPRSRCCGIQSWVTQNGVVRFEKRNAEAGRIRGRFAVSRFIEASSERGYVVYGKPGISIVPGLLLNDDVSVLTKELARVSSEIPSSREFSDETSFDVTHFGPLIPTIDKSGYEPHVLDNGMLALEPRIARRCDESSALRAWREPSASGADADVTVRNSRGVAKDERLRRSGVGAKKTLLM